MDIYINYHGVADPVTRIRVGDWIDLRSAEDVELEAGEFRKISLGVSMKLPDGYEAIIAARSSTYQKWGILMVNGIGVIDNSYCGNNDIWQVPVLAMRRTHIYKGDRIAQFRIMPNQPEVHFIEVDRLLDEDRGGFGSTGSN